MTEPRLRDDLQIADQAEGIVLCRGRTVSRSQHTRIKNGLASTCCS
jgi:hypothetical protein